MNRPGLGGQKVLLAVPAQEVGTARRVDQAIKGKGRSEFLSSLFWTLHPVEKKFSCTRVHRSTALRKPELEAEPEQEAETEPEPESLLEPTGRRALRAGTVGTGRQ
eukprot:COSAG04_NODE_1230_length_7679_cov_1.728232_3_plen_106_part_00